MTGLPNLQPKILTLTPDILKLYFPEGKVKCMRCDRILRALDNVVLYPHMHPVVPMAGLIYICEPCLDVEIEQAGWTPPK